MERIVAPEILDSLPSNDRRAIRSRRDLQRLNFLMGHLGILERTIRKYASTGLLVEKRLDICELGAGDGSLALKLARQFSASGFGGGITLVDQQLIPSEPNEFSRQKEWRIQRIRSDVHTWLSNDPSQFDLIFANLFLHHFVKDELGLLLARVQCKTRLFVACEPRRSRLSWLSSCLVGLAGCNAVTRHDAKVSVRAGFKGNELSQLWNSASNWFVRERNAGLFSHCFVARRNA
jgi:hypothetical protein